MRVRAAVTGVLSAALMSGLSGAAPALGADPAIADLAHERTAIAEFQRLDQQLQNVGWRLVRGNAPFCASRTGSIGLQLQDLASYGGPAVARAALGLTGDFAVQTAAAGSPADLTGEFSTNREIAAIGTLDPNSLDAAERLDWTRLARAHDHIDAALARDGSIAIAFADGQTVTVAAASVCATRFELSGEGGRAVADGRRVVIGVGFPGFAMAEDLFAAAVAHELAHNLLGHRARLDAEGRSRSIVRATEREADRLMPWLLANAGYDPAAAARFFRSYRPDSGAMLFLRGSHDGWKRRAERVEGELPAIAAALESTGAADWSAHLDLPGSASPAQ